MAGAEAEAAVAEEAAAEAAEAEAGRRRRRRRRRTRRRRDHRRGLARAIARRVESVDCQHVSRSAVELGHGRMRRGLVLHPCALDVDAVTGYADVVVRRRPRNGHGRPEWLTSRRYAAERWALSCQAVSSGSARDRRDRAARRRAPGSLSRAPCACGTPGRALLAALVRFPSGRDPAWNARACRRESAADTRGSLLLGLGARNPNGSAGRRWLEPSRSIRAYPQCGSRRTIGTSQARACAFAR